MLFCSIFMTSLIATAPLEKQRDASKSCSHNLIHLFECIMNFLSDLCDLCGELLQFFRQFKIQFEQVFNW